ncbi:thaumatin-like protein 1b [Miscanthus floridulus]|uniref:thaumatin-like protein 1b n=1 Tax=Miscanthus floridulus TaxID=154761 RepID=UPI00345807D2
MIAARRGIFNISCVLATLVTGADAATFTITNSCGYTVWPGILSNAGAPPPSTTGFELAPGQSAAVTVATSWSGRIWARTLCATSADSGAFACATADCGSGAVECSGRGAAPSATLAELTLAGGTSGDDFYDVSLVDGFNVPMLVAPRASSAAAANGSSSCWPTGCPADLNAACPAELRVAGAGGGAAVACRSACEAFAAVEYCCSGAYGSPATCAPKPYCFFKVACPSTYSYAYDDATSTFTCASAAGGGGYDVVFCPSASSLKSGGNPEAAGLPPSTMEFSGDTAGSLTTTRDVVAALLQTVVVFSAMVVVI